MNERMEREIERTVAALRPSLPRRGNSDGLPALLGVAARELSVPVLLAIVAGTAAFGALLAAVLRTPLLTAFCTAPLPAMLSLHRFVLSVNEPMRELEMTLRYSYAEMMTARTLLVLLWSMLALLALSLVLWSKTGEGFVRLALAGAAPELLMCALVLRLGRKADAAVVSAVLWCALTVAMVQFRLDEVMSAAPTYVYVLLALAGAAAMAASLMSARRNTHAFGR